MPTFVLPTFRPSKVHAPAPQPDQLCLQSLVLKSCIHLMHTCTISALTRNAPPDLNLSAACTPKAPLSSLLTKSLEAPAIACCLVLVLLPCIQPHLAFVQPYLAARIDAQKVLPARWLYYATLRPDQRLYVLPRHQAKGWALS